MVQSCGKIFTSVNSLGVNLPRGIRTECEHNDHSSIHTKNNLLTNYLKLEELDAKHKLI